MKRIISLIIALVLVLGCFASYANAASYTTPSWVSGATKLPSSFHYIEDEAFYGDTSLTDLSISSTVKSIGANAFAGCTKLKRICILSVDVTLGKNALGTSGETKEIWAPSGSTAQAYAKAYGYTFHSLSADATDLISYAYSLLGTKYDSGNPTKYRLEKDSNGNYIALDCIFFVYACYYDVKGIRLPTSCATMQSLTSQSVFTSQGLSAIKITDPKQLAPGDIICWKNDSSSSCTHVGLYVGDGVFINASSSGGKVQTGNFNFDGQSSTYTPYYIRNFLHAWRIQ